MNAAEGGDRRAIFRSQSRPRRHAAGLAARTRECPEALPGARRRAQSRDPDAAADRGRNPREAAARGLAYLLFVYTGEAVAIILVAAAPDGFAVLVMAVTADPG